MSKYEDVHCSTFSLGLGLIIAYIICNSMFKKNQYDGILILISVAKKVQHLFLSYLVEVFTKLM